MNRYVILVLVLVFIFFVVPKSLRATKEVYEVVTKLPKEDIVLYAKKTNEIYIGTDFKGETYFIPFGINVTNPTYAPKIFYQDINEDGKKELIITLTKGYGSAVRDYSDKMYQAKAIEFIMDINKNPFYVQINITPYSTNG